MSDKNIKELEIAFESENISKDFENAVLHEIELKERLSAPFSLSADVLLPKPLQKNKLRGILGEKTKITIRAKLGSSENGRVLYATRFVNGIVTKMRYEGIIFSGNADSEKTTCARYRLTVEPVLSLLAKTRKTRSFKGLSPHEVVKSILMEYGIKPNTDLVDNDEDKNQFFQQQGESDLKFIHRLMRSYGLNYNFIHQGECGNWDPKFVITNKWLFESKDKLSSKVAYTDGEQTKINGSDQMLLQGSVISDNEGKIFIRHWVMEENSVQPTRAGSDFLNNDALVWAIGDRLNQYETYYGEAPLIRDIYRRSRFLKAAFARESSLWKGETESLSVSPGSLVQLHGVFGDDEYLTVLTVQTDLFVRSSWPNDLAFPPQEDLTAKPLVIQMQAVERIGDEDCGSFANVSKGVEVAETGFSIVTGKVTINNKKNGEEPKLADEFPTSVPVHLDVVKQTETEPVTANVLLPFAGQDGGIYRYPKDGDNVALIACNGSYYIVGYLYQPNKVDFPSGYRDEKEKSSVWSNFKHVDDCNGFLKTYSGNQISMLKGATKDEVAIDLLLNKRIEDFYYKEALINNNSTLLNNLEQYKKEAYEAVDEYLKAQEDVYKHREDSTKKTKLEETWKVLAGKAELLAADLKESLKDNQSEISIISKGDSPNITLSALECPTSPKSGEKTKTNKPSSSLLSLGADHAAMVGQKNILIQSKDGTVKIVAPEKIQLQVGFNSITMDQNGIVLRSLKGPKMVGGFLDSSIKMDSFSGVSISGMSVAMNGCLSASMSDALGGNYTASYGAIRSSGLECSTSSINLVDGIKKFIGFTETAISELSSMSSLKNSAKNSTMCHIWLSSSLQWSNLADSLFDTSLALKSVGVSISSSSSMQMLIKIILQLLQLGQLIIDLTVSTLIASQAKFITEPHGALTGKDILVITSTSVKLFNTISSMACIYFAKATGGHPLKTSSISLSCGSVNLETAQYTATTEKASLNSNLMAGDELLHDRRDEELARQAAQRGNQ